MKLPLFPIRFGTALAVASCFASCASQPHKVVRTAAVRTSAVRASKTVATPARTPRIETRIWRQGEPALRLIPKEEGFCALSMVTGGFAGGGELVRVWIAEDGYWYLSGRSYQEGVAAECIVVHYR